MDKKYYYISVKESATANKLIFWKSNYRGFTSIKENAGMYSYQDIKKTGDPLLRKKSLKKYKEYDNCFITTTEFESFNKMWKKYPLKMPLKKDYANYHCPYHVNCQNYDNEIKILLIMLCSLYLLSL